MLVQRNDGELAYDIALAIRSGFDRHYKLFRAESTRAKHRFETQDWQGQQRAQRERISFYDVRVDECVLRLEREFNAGQVPMAVWQQVKLFYIGMLVDHHQPELAETFFNSVTTTILHHSYFKNDFIFVLPAISTEYIENQPDVTQPSYRAYYPRLYDGDLHAVLTRVVEDYQLAVGFADLSRDVARVLQVLAEPLRDAKKRTNFQIQVLSSLFFRNKGAYVVGKLVYGYQELPFALPILFNDQGQLEIDAVLFGETDLRALFSFARAYFLVDMQVPSAYVQFLRSLMPNMPRAEIYNALGLAKQGKTLWHRDFRSHLQHSSDKFRIAPGIKGMVMLVFDMPSFPYVFKIIKDHFPPPKETTREQVEAKYRLVKEHDRVGRMADTLEFRNMALSRARFEDSLIAEIQQFAPSMIDIIDLDGDGNAEVVFKHIYVERRMIPLNLYLQESFDNGLDTPEAHAQMAHAVVEYGNAIKDLVAANIFPGDMLWKNFGVTRHGKVVFYDYDEIEYITDCNFRQVPPPRDEDDEMSGDIWYSVGPRDVFPETFAPFLLGNQAVRAIFMQHHADLLSPAFWQSHKERIARGEVLDVFPYDPERRFAYQREAATPLFQL